MSSNDENSGSNGGSQPPDPGAEWFEDGTPPPDDEDGSSSSSDSDPGAAWFEDDTPPDDEDGSSNSSGSDPGAVWIDNDCLPPLGQDEESAVHCWNSPLDPGAQWFEGEDPEFAPDANQHSPEPWSLGTHGWTFGSRQPPLDVDYEDDDAGEPANDDTPNPGTWPFGSEVLPAPEPPLPHPPQFAMLDLLGFDMSESGSDAYGDRSESSSSNFEDGGDARPPPALDDPEPEETDATRIFRSEALVTDTDLRVDVADSLRRNVLGDETVETSEHSTHIRGNYSQIAGERDRTAGSYERSTDNEEMYLIDGSYTERVGGRMTIRATLSAESMVGGTYTNTITGAYLRIAGWVDLMVWGGWMEADLIRAELAGLMIRSHVAFAHAALVRLSVASRYIDDLTNRIEHFGLFSSNEQVYVSAGVPGGGMDNEA